MTWTIYLTFLSITLAATLSPGPSMLLALQHGISHGVLGALRSAAGNIVGNLVLALLSLASLSSLLLLSSHVFEVIRWAGIAYLLYIGIRIWLAADAEPDWKALGKATTKSHGRLFVDGFVVAVANPKGLVFYTALFPQFIHFGQATGIEYTVVFSTLIMVGYLGFLLYAAFGMHLRGWFHRPTFRQLFNRLTALAFLGCGIMMAFKKA